MFKKIAIFLSLLLNLVLAPLSNAAENSFVTIINPVRGNDFWDLKSQTPQTAILGQMGILKKYNVAATWLVRVDVLQDQGLVKTLKAAPATDEIGLFLEVTPTWTNLAGVNYRQSESWHFAGSVFLAGYTLPERQRLIDSGFEKFKNIFGYNPRSVGAWWVDSFSAKYMQEKYGITAVLIVADQYSTDNYQIWGQYWQSPYYPAKTNMLNPARDSNQKIPVVVTQWAARDPVGGFGKGVEESTLSVQPNDYIDYHNLDINYFGKLVDIYTNQNLNFVNQLVVGLENSYSWEKYAVEYSKQIELLAKKRNNGQFALLTQSDFANWYKAKFPEASPTQVIVADDPLGSEKKVVWVMNPYYRAGFIFTGDKAYFRDIRQYIDGAEELCLKTACTEVNFATFATRVLDEVTKGNRWVIDQGKIKDFVVTKSKDIIRLTYTNQVSKNTVIELMPRDISVNSDVKSIDAAILQAQSQTQLDTNLKINEYFANQSANKNTLLIFLEALKFILFLNLAIFIPGLVLISILKLTDSFFLKLFLAAATGIVSLTLVFYFSSLLKVWWLVILYILLMVGLFLKKKIYQEITFNGKNLILISLVLAGTIFQSIPVLASSSATKYGISFWGPNGHDGVWHIALVKQLIEGVVPNNPIFAGEVLKNYHYFYDLLVAASSKLGFITVEDLIFRFYPVVFSIFLGVGTYYLCKRLFNSSLAAFLGVYLVYFAGSFGWVVEFIRERHFGGESAFWANQPVSFNLNPPFAISLILLIAFIYLLSWWFEKGRGLFILVLILGSLVAFKAYAGVLVFGSLILLMAFNLVRRKDPSVLKILVGGGMLSSLILIPNYGVNFWSSSSGIFNWSPFWFVHSMIDSPDRVGWTRLTLTRTVGFGEGNILKIFGAETIGLLIFWVGNLGVRVLCLGLVVKSKVLFKDLTILYVFFLTTLSLSIPLLFTQVGNPWNSIQFFYYGLYTTAVFSGVVLRKLYVKGAIFRALVILILIVAPINAITTASGYLYPVPHTALNFGEKEALDFLSGQNPGIVLTYPFDETRRQNLTSPIPLPFYETTAYVSAFSGKPTYLEDTIQQDILQTIYKEREVLQSYFFEDFDENKRRQFLTDNKIKYIYLPKILSVFLPADKLNLKIIYQNSSVSIYQVLN